MRIYGNSVAVLNCVFFFGAEGFEINFPLILLGLVWLFDVFMIQE
jgi:hypothetical protein